MLNLGLMKIRLGSASRDYGGPLNHPRLTDGVVIQTVSESFGSFMKPKVKKRGKRKK
jgi:hypothetical protein